MYEDITCITIELKFRIKIYSTLQNSLTQEYRNLRDHSNSS